MVVVVEVNVDVDVDVDMDGVGFGIGQKAEAPMAAVERMVALMALLKTVFILYRSARVLLVSVGDSNILHLYTVSFVFVISQ